MAVSLPAPLLGLPNDLTKKVPPVIRISGAALAALLGIWLAGTQVSWVDIIGLDSLMSLAPVAILVTPLMVAGFTNAMNSVDGLHGLASGLALVMLAGTGAVAWQLNDVPLASICATLALALAVLGFRLQNFPRGIMLLGDGGAYFIGFLLAQIWILLIARHAEVSSVWFVMAVAAHPTVETVFGIYRRKLMHNVAAALAGGPPRASSARRPAATRSRSVVPRLHSKNLGLFQQVIWKVDSGSHGSPLQFSANA